MKNCSREKPLLPTNWVIGGVVGFILVFLLISGIRSFFSSSDSPSSSEGSSQNQNNSSGQSGGGTTKPAYSYPARGKAYATPQKPVKAYIDNNVMRLKFWGDGIVIKQNGKTICVWKKHTDPDSSSIDPPCWKTLLEVDYEIYSLNGETLVEWGIP